MKKSIKSTVLDSLIMLSLAAFCLHGQAHAETGSTASKYEGQTLCDTGDYVYTSCTTKTGKNLSICVTAKPAPDIMYFVYGTPEKILVSSPRTGRFPVGHTFIDEDQIKSGGDVYSFTDNGKQYLAYHFYDGSDPEKYMEGDGLITRNDTNYKIISHYSCISNVLQKKNDNIVNNEAIRYSYYAVKEEKDSSHKSRTKGINSSELPDEIYENLYEDK